MAQLHIVLVGCGGWGKHILRDFLALDVRVTVVDPSLEARAHARTAGALAVVGELGQVDTSASGTPVDGFVVAAPTSLHATLLRTIFARWPHTKVFCEKPLTDRVADARDIVERWPDQVFLMDKWRYHRGITAMRELVRSKEFGALRGLATTRVQWGYTQSDSDVSWILAPHDLAIAYELCGQYPTPREAVAHTTGGAITHLEALLDCGGGVWQRLTVSSQHPTKVRELLVYCDQAVLSYRDGGPASISITRVDDAHGRELPVTEQRSFTESMPLKLELEAFCAHLRGGPAPKSSARQALQVVETIAWMRSLALGAQRSRP